MPKTYDLGADGRSIRCLACYRTSHNEHDVNMKYCGYCHKYLEPELICDFCEGKSPIVRDIVATSRMSGYLEDGRPVVDGDLRWGACAECSLLIEQENWEKLIERGIDGAERTFAAFGIRERAAVRQSIVGVWKLVFGDLFRVD